MKTAKEWADELGEGWWSVVTGDGRSPKDASEEFVIAVQRDAAKAALEAAAKAVDTNEQRYEEGMTSWANGADAIRAIDPESLMGGGT